MQLPRAADVRAFGIPVTCTLAHRDTFDANAESVLLCAVQDLLPTQLLMKLLRWLGLAVDLLLQVREPQLP